MAEALKPQTPNIHPPVPTALNPEVALLHGQPISMQIFMDASIRKRMGLEGLSWEQGSNHFVISAHDTVLTTHYDRVKNSSWHSVKDNSLWHKQGVGLVRGGREIPTAVQQGIPTWRIDEYDRDGDLVATNTYDLDGVATRLDDAVGTDHPGSHGQVTRVWWQDAPPKAPADLSPSERRNIPIPIHPEGRFETIMLDRERLDVPGEEWVGLTWVDQGRKRGEPPYKFQIIKDTTRRAMTLQGTQLVRTYVAKKYNNAGKVVGFQTFEDHQLQQYFDGVSLFNGTKTKPAANIADLHWEIPKKSPDPRIKTWAGQVAIRTGAGVPLTPVTAAKKLQSYREGRELLDYVDVLDLPESAELVETMFKDPVHNKFSPVALTSAVTEYGKEGIRDLATAMRDNYLEALDKLGLPPPPQEKFSISWILWDMAKQRYLAQHPDKASDKDIDTYGSGSQPPFGLSVHSYGLVDPFGTDEYALDKRRQMIDREVAVAFVAHALMPIGSRKVPIMNGDGTVTEEVRFVYGVNGAVKNLQKFIKGDASQILDKVTSGKVESPDKLSSADLSRLGRLLRRQIVQ